MEEGEARIIGNGRRGFTGLYIADDFRGPVTGEVGECCGCFVAGGVPTVVNNWAKWAIFPQKLDPDVNPRT